MSGNHGNFGHNIFSRKDFLKLIGAGSLFVGLGALGIPNVLKNIRGASAMTGSATSTNTTNATGTTSTNTTNATGASVAPTSGNTDIRPFNVNVPEAELTENLDRTGVSQTHLLQQGSQRRTLCSLGTATTLFTRGSCGLQITAPIAEQMKR